FSVGKVVSITGRTVEVKVDKTKNTSHLLYKGELLRNVSVGSYIKIVKGFTRIIGKVEGEKVVEDKAFPAHRGYASDKDKVDRTLTVSLLGFFRGTQFERGIKELPLLDNECFLLQRSEFEQVHNFTKSNDEPLTIGTLSFEKGQAIRVGVNSLFASHIGIFGNTGSGKSYTLAKMYRELFLRYKDNAAFRQRARFFLLDFNGEYVAEPEEEPDDIIIDPEYKSVFKLSTSNAEGDRFPVSSATINDADFWAVFLEATEKTQMPFLRRAIANDYVAARLGNADDVRDLIASRIWEAINSGDRTLERSIVTNFLKEIDDALQGNESLEALIADYEARLKFHNTNNVFYYENNGIKHYANDPGFAENFVVVKVGQVDIDPAALDPMDRIRL